MPHIGASGIVGVALETVPGTYVAPTHFIPIYSESVAYKSEPVERRPIRNTPGLVGVLPGNGSVEGDLEMDLLSDVFPVLMAATRCTYAKTGTAPTYTYTYTPSPTAVPLKTLSLSIKRGNEVFGYPGCIIGTYSISIGDDGLLKMNASIFGLDEASQSTLTPVWPTAEPFGSGMYSLQIPTATQIFDTDTFEFSSEDNAEAQYRIKNSRAAQFVKFGESNASIKVERDFENRAQYDLFKAGTAQSITLAATRGANEGVTITMPVSYMKSYEVNLGGQGDLVRASVEFVGAIDGTGKHYQIVAKSATNLT